MKTKKQTIYVSEDGKEFVSSEACLAHEEVLRKEAELTSYWRVIHKPDLNEGRGFYSATYIKLIGVDYLRLPLVEDWCFRKFGRKINFVQGVDPIESWYIIESNAKDWKSPPKQKVGDYCYDAESIVLKMGEGEIGLYET